MKRSQYSLTALLPLFAFLALAAIFFSQLLSGDDPSAIPSPMIASPVPEFTLQLLPYGAQSNAAESAVISNDDINQGVVIVNIWASWCVPCRLEHPFLTQLSQRDDLKIFGINYKDHAENAIGFLDELGNPFDIIGIDSKGRSAINWGVYGVPETFIVKNGRIIHKHIGPIHEPRAVESFMKELDAALLISG